MPNVNMQDCAGDTTSFYHMQIALFAASLNYACELPINKWRVRNAFEMKFSVLRQKLPANRMLVVPQFSNK